MRRLASLTLLALAAGCAGHPRAVSDIEAPPAPIRAVEAPAAVVPPAPTTPPPPPRPSAAVQWLYGSAEADIVSRQTYAALADFAIAAARRRVAGQQSVIVDTAPAAPDQLAKWGRCRAGQKPAVIFDADETLIWNAGQARWTDENKKTFDSKVWDEWERMGAAHVVALPGAVDTVRRLRAAGVNVIVNTNRSSANAAQTAAALKAAGLGDFAHGETLFLMGDDATGSSKDARRAVIASRWCVVAMAGDQLGDFWSGFNNKALRGEQRRALATAPQFVRLWGRGWFMLPNPTYGPWDRYGYDDVFPAQLRWEPKEGSN